MTVATELDLALQQIDGLLSKLQVRASQVAQQPATGSASRKTEQGTNVSLNTVLRTGSSLRLQRQTCTYICTAMHGCIRIRKIG